MNEKKKVSKNFNLNENENFISIDASADLNNSIDNRNSSETIIELKSSKNKKRIKLPKKKIKKSKQNIIKLKSSPSYISRLKSRKNNKRTKKVQDIFSLEASNYSAEDLELWKELYEQIGSFKKVSKYLKENHKKIVSAPTIKKYLKNKFKWEGRNFDEWAEEFKIIPLSRYRYSKDEILKWEKLFEEIGTLQGVSIRYMELFGKAPKPDTIHEVLKRKFSNEGRNFEKWFQKFHKIPSSIIPYTEQDENKWEQLFEGLGSFHAVEREIKKENQNIGPSHVTIIKRLRDKFKKENRDFSDWLKKYHIKYTDIEGYSDKEVIEWIKLFEQIGKLRHLEKQIKELYGAGPNRKTILRRIKKYFKDENKNFDEWYNKYNKSHIHLSYTNKELNTFEDLFEKIGSFEGVQDELENQYGIVLHAGTIKRNLRSKFLLEKRNFDEWLEKYDKTKYYEKEIGLWENLYKKIGSFIGVSNYLHNKYVKAPSNTTIERRLREKFKKEKRDFKKFKKRHFQAYHEMVVRIFFQLIFLTQFPKKHPEWLINPKTGRRMELDGYNELLKIAFEYNGPHHYKFIRQYHKKFQKFVNQLNRDQIKKELCNKNNVILIIIPYKIKPNKMQNYIIKKFKMLTERDLLKEYREKNGLNMPKYNHNHFFFKENLDKFL